jgi:hypothetical protein
VVNGALGIQGDPIVSWSSPHMQDSVRDNRLHCISQKLLGCNEGPLGQAT